MKILLVDDDEFVRAALVDVLTDAGFEVVATANPHEALGLPDAIGPPSVVITDIDLGSGLNGFDVATGAHLLWPTVQVVLISGLPVDHTGQVLSQHDRYLQKPFSSMHLLDVITESLREASAIAALA
jgi:DNA-binding response OmpR family regulator